MQQSVTSQPLHLDETSQIDIKYIIFLCHFSRFLHNNPFVFQQNYWIFLRKWTFKYLFFIKNTKVNVVKSSINCIKYLLLPWEVVHIEHNHQRELDPIPLLFMQLPWEIITMMLSKNTTFTYFILSFNGVEQSLYHLLLAKKL